MWTGGGTATAASSPWAGGGVTWYFLDNEQYFRRPELYGYMDDGERFGFFSRAVVRMLGHFKFWPDVIHCNDWQTARCPSISKTTASGRTGSEYQNNPYHP